MDELPPLPDCLLLQIFQHLSFEDLCLGVRLVCTRWWKVSHDTSLWKTVDLPEQFSNKRFQKLLNQIQDMVEELDCSKCENLTEHGFLKLISLEFPKLRRLAMPVLPSGPTSGSKLFSALAAVCPNLEEVENIHPNIFDEVDPYKCQSLFKNLKVFHDRPVSTFGRMRNVAPKLDLEKRQKWRSGITAVSSFCLNVEQYKCCRGNGYLDDKGLRYLSQMLPNITKLELRQCSITDEGIRKFFEFNTSPGGLTEIMFDQPGEITDVGLAIIGQHCPNLQHVKLSRCQNITSKGVRCLLKASVTELHLNNAAGFGDKQRAERVDFDNGTLKDIAECCPKLQILRLLYSKPVGFRGMLHLVDGCRNLQGLMLFECPGIDDRALQVIQGFNFLKAMVLVNCNVSPKGIIDQILVAPSLQRLTLYCNSNAFLGSMEQLTEDTFCKLDCDDGEFRPNVMRRLTLRGVSGDFLQLLTVLCPTLHTLDIRDAVAVSVPSINMVLRNCEYLRALDISSIPLLDDTFITSLMVNAEHLKRLSLGNAIRHLDITALSNVLSSHPSLSMVAMDTHDAAVDEENFLYMMKRSRHGKALLHVDPESRKKDTDTPRTFRIVEFHCTPIKYLRSVTQPASLYIPVAEFPCFNLPQDDDEDIMFQLALNASLDTMPPLEDEDGMAGVGVIGGGGERDDGGSGGEGSSSEEEVSAAAAVSPQLSVWLGKKLKID